MSLRPRGLKPTRLPYPWDSPGKHPGVGCHCLFQGIFPAQESNPGVLHCRQIPYHLSHFILCSLFFQCSSIYLICFYNGKRQTLWDCTFWTSLSDNKQETIKNQLSIQVRVQALQTFNKCQLNGSSNQFPIPFGQSLRILLPCISSFTII